MTYEEIEQQQMEIARNKAVEAKKMAAESLKRVKNSKGYQPVTSNKKLTIAKEFQFNSDKRLRSHSVDNVKSPISDLSQILRKEDKSCVSDISVPLLDKLTFYSWRFQLCLGNYLQIFQLIELALILSQSMPYTLV